MPEEQLDFHEIYGTWDSVINDQFMIFYPESGDWCTVFLFSGFDYGGGIEKWFHAKLEEVEEIVNLKNISDYERKELISKVEPYKRY